MKYTDTDELSISTIFFVTGVSFFLFSLMIKILDGNHASPLLWTAGIATLLGTLIWIGKAFTKIPGRSKKKPSH